MEEKVNRNILWSEVFFRQIYKLGVKNAVICPGSRSTPLVFGLTRIPKIKKYNLVDERSAAFFALGVAKKTKSPVAVITTSGTAVAELYPSVVEAYFQRIPLILCTADRPPELQNCGANQTINQKNIFENHTRYFFDTGIPKLSVSGYKTFLTLTKKALSIATIRNRGPVHINLPFDKPFEPDNFTDNISRDTYNVFASDELLHDYSDSDVRNSIPGKVIKEIEKASGGIILFNEKNPVRRLCSLVSKLSKKINFPVIDDNTSGIRFYSKKQNVISNASAFLNAEKFKPDILLQFGDAPLSAGMLKFMENTSAKKYLIDCYGDIKDPSRTYTKVLKIASEQFCENVLRKINSKKYSSFSHTIWDAETKCEKVKNDFLQNTDGLFEGRIIHETVNLLPENSNLFISNSMPVRDFDLFVAGNNKNISVFTNRGASGIDGINSTALGVASQSKHATFLITGDLAFYHDLNGLLASKKYSIPLVVILINNNGGGIFNMLPVSKHKNILASNFILPLNLEFKYFIEGYGGYHKEIPSLGSLRKEFQSAVSNKKLTVLEFKTNSEESAKLRKKYLKLVADNI